MTPHGTTVVAVRRAGKIAIASDGQTTWGNTPLLTDSHGRKLRELEGVLFGFSGPTGGTIALWRILQKHRPDWHEAAIESRCEATKEVMALIAPLNGRIAVLTPLDGSLTETTRDALGIGSGADFAMGAAEAMLDLTDWDAEKIASRAVHVASRLCIYTSGSIVVQSCTAVTADTLAEGHTHLLLVEPTRLVVVGEDSHAKRPERPLPGQPERAKD